MDTWEERLFAGVCQAGCTEGWGGWTAKRWRVRAFLNRYPATVCGVARGRWPEQSRYVRRWALQAFLARHPETVPGLALYRWPKTGRR